MNRLTALPIFLSILFGINISKAKEKIKFNRDIRPLLSNNCFACHGPDEHDRKAKLRLDIGEGGGFKDLDGFQAIVPNDPGNSEIIARMISDDEDEMMPPPETGKKLNKEQIELIKQWINEGAEYEGHWSFTSPSKTAKTEGHPIDHFINTKLKTQGLEISPVAPAHTLLRRLSLDLTGILPTTSELSLFKKNYEEDPSNAITKATDRLLKSPRYGERMATFWLDLVRYADSIGYHSDTNMDVYLYREWVINAFNSNLKYDQFTREQIAGDLLPNSTDDQKVASGYNRLLQTTEEGGAQPKEYVAIYAADRVRNVSSAWLGGTLGCAQCHDHKYDPYTAKDFYSMAAFFADIKEKAVGRRDPGMAVATGEYKNRLATIEKEIIELTSKTNKSTTETKAAQIEWEKSLSGSTKPILMKWHVIGPISGGDSKKAFDTEFGPERGIDPKAVISGKKWQDRTDLVDGKVHNLGNATNSVWYLYRLIKSPTATQLPLSLGSDDGIKVWLNGKELLKSNPSRGAAPDQEKITLELKEGNNQFLMKIINHGSGGGFYFKAKGNELPPAIAASLTINAEERNESQKEVIEKYYLSISPVMAELRKKISILQKEKSDMQKNLPKTLVSISTKPREMKVLPRGNWLDDSGEIVKPAIPEFLGKIQYKGDRANRLDLANWIVSKDNPMTSRAFVNRLWKLFFGIGISSNVDDLGSQGEWPSHPQLLDWLAVEFVESGWDVQHIIRLMVSSKAYAQSSIVSSDLNEKDPLNQLFARQSRFRVDAEMIRDNALFISGLLNEKIGGRSVKPYQPAGYWRHLNFPSRKWSHDNNENQYRRGLYTHWQRSFLHPSLLAFDAPSREECTAERPRSNTPLQALILLNDVTYVEAARSFAERIIKEGGADPNARINWALNTALSREGTEQEINILMQLQAQQSNRYKEDTEAATAFNQTGIKPPPENIDPTELASWTSVARTILNLHETITRH